MELILNGNRISSGTCSFLETFFFYFHKYHIVMASHGMILESVL